MGWLYHPPMTRHFLRDLDLSAAEQTLVLDRAAHMKQRPEAYAQAMRGKVLGMIFQKSSTRTRVSFEAGAIQMGGQAIFLSSRDIQIGRGEPITDTAKVLSRYLDILMIRTYKHEEVQGLASASRVPVINGLDDLLHPCQILADLQTIKENRGTLAGQTLVYVGDGNNMAHSMMLGGALAGVNVRIITPREYAPKDEIVREAQTAAKASGAKIEVCHDLGAVEGADVVYTDVWASMGQEEEQAKRVRDFSGFQVDGRLMKRAKPDAIFLHCLPAHRGEEVSAEVIDGPQSRVFDQAENRLHAQKALMTFLLENR